MSTPAFSGLVLRGGYTRLVAWRTDAEEAVDTRLFKPVAFTHDVGRETYTDGAPRRGGLARGVAPEVIRWGDVRTLRGWAATGAEVRAVLLSLGGMHYQWDEAVGCDTQPVDYGAGRFQAERLWLRSEAVDAAVYEDPDLLAPLYAGAATWSGDARRVLPAPGLTVYAWIPGTDGLPTTGLTLSADDYGGGSLASAAGAEVSLALPAGVWSLHLTGAAGPRPVLSTRPSGRPQGVVLVDADGAALVDADGFALLVY